MIGRDIYFNLDKKYISISNSPCSISESFVAPRFHKMYSHDKNPLTEMFREIPHGVLMAGVMVVG